MILKYNKMKTKILASVTLAILFFTLIISCKKDEVEKEKEEKPIPPHKFLNRPLSGKIDSEDYVFVSGSKVIPIVSPSQSSFYLTNVATTGKDTCDQYGYGDMMAQFGLYGAIETKVYGIGVGTNNPCTLFGTDSAFTKPRGAVEILTISNKTITGRIDAMVDSNTYVNGNFSVSVCP